MTLSVFDASPDFGGYFSPVDYPEDYGGGGGDVFSWLAFNSGADGIGADLPAGRVRVYQQDADGAGLLIGESRLAHTAEGQDIRLLLGKAFELAGERVMVDYAIISRDVARETIEITLSNYSDDAVDISVPERLYRWSDWEIIESTLPYEKLDAATIEFRAALEAGEETTLRYTVEYTYPRNR